MTRREVWLLLPTTRLENLRARTHACMRLINNRWTPFTDGQRHLSENPSLRVANRAAVADRGGAGAVADRK